MRLRELCGFAAGVALWLAAGAVASAAQPGLSNPFFAFDNGTGRDQHVRRNSRRNCLRSRATPESATREPADPRNARGLDAQGLKMFSIYVNACVDPGRGPTTPA